MSSNKAYPFIFYFILFLLFKATLVAYASSQAGVKLELQSLAYTPATAKWDPSLICYLHHSSQQHQILYPLSEARDRTHSLMDPNRVRQPLSHKRNSHIHSINCMLMQLSRSSQVNQKPFFTVNQKSHGWVQGAQVLESLRITRQ